jgi:hypothetical protein
MADSPDRRRSLLVSGLAAVLLRDNAPELSALAHAGVEGPLVWIACPCGASMARRVDEHDALASNS